MCSNVQTTAQPFLMHGSLEPEGYGHVRETEFHNVQHGEVLMKFSGMVVGVPKESIPSAFKNSSISSGFEYSDSSHREYICNSFSFESNVFGISFSIVTKWLIILILKMVYKKNETFLHDLMFNVVSRILD